MPNSKNAPIFIIYQKMQSQSQPTLPPPSSLNQSHSLTQRQLDLLSLCEQFSNNTSTPNIQIQTKLKQYSWKDIYPLITDSKLPTNTRIICCSVVKYLLYHKKFVDNPEQMLQQLIQFYLIPDTLLQKAQEICEIIIETIPTLYFDEQQKQSVVQSLLQKMGNLPQFASKILKIVTIFLQSMQTQKLNNQVITGELLLFIEAVLKMENIQKEHKIDICDACFKVIAKIVDIITDDDDLENGHVVEQFLANSSLAKKLMQAIISDSSNNIQILTQNPRLNLLKLTTLQLYSTIYIYSLEQTMFQLCLSSLLTHPTLPHDQQSQIFQQILKMLQRSITNQAYYHYLHKNCQNVLISLLSLLRPKQSLMEMAINNPEEYVQILYDFAMEQQREGMEVKVGSLISSLCLYIDGYLSFFGSLAIMILKRWNGTVKDIVGSQQYIQIIDIMWSDSQQHKLATCILILCSISDQLQKRPDLQSPLKLQLKSSTHLLSLPLPLSSIKSLPLPPYLLCRLMLLYAFQGYPSCLDVFLPYKGLHLVYQLELQDCFKIMSRYYNRYPECKKYLDTISHVVILGDSLTPLMETMILTGDVSIQVQQAILEKLVLWMHEGVQANSVVKCSKIGNLMSILIQRMAVVDYKQSQQVTYSYIQPLLKSLVSNPSYIQMQQYILQPVPSFIKKFPSLASSSSPNSSSSPKLESLVQLSFKIIQRNHGVLNNCLDILFEITFRANIQMLGFIMQIYMGCLESQPQETDHWQCYYGMENCVIRAWEFGHSLGLNHLNYILTAAANYKQPIVIIKSYMLVLSMLSSRISTSPPPPKQLPLLPNHILPLQIPPYQSKPFLVYLLTVTPYLYQNIEQSYSLLKMIIKLLARQKNIAKQLKKYQQQIYEGAMQEISQATIDAYNITRKLVHPLLLKGVDVYKEFRKCWGFFQNREAVIAKMTQKEKESVMEFAGQALVNSKVRKIYKVKNSGNEQPGGAAGQGDKDSQMEVS